MDSPIPYCPQCARPLKKHPKFAGLVCETYTCDWGPSVSDPNWLVGTAFLTDVRELVELDQHYGLPEAVREGINKVIACLPKPTGGTKNG